MMTSATGPARRLAGTRRAAICASPLTRPTTSTSRTVPGAVDILGIGHTEASVTVNSQAAYRRGEYYHRALAVSNSGGPVYQSVTVTATLGSSTNRSGNLFLPAATESYSYDLDGNMTGDGRWNYTWDGENRLVLLLAKSNVPTAAKRKVEFEYDGAGDGYGRRSGRQATVSITSTR
jgi:hypothetical protein